MGFSSVAFRAWLVLWLWCAVAWSVAQAKEQAAGEAAAGRPVSAASMPTQEALRERVRAQLDGSTWTLELRPDAGGKAVQDTVAFAGRTVSSKWLTKAGYNASNYSVQVEADGLAIWETMQSNEKEGLAFWRGELRGEKMSGILSKQPTEGAAVNYRFTATKLGAAQAAVKPQAAQPTAPAQPAVSQAGAAQPGDAAQAAPASGEPKKRKRRFWF
jgi:hypothetical protein